MKGHLNFEQSAVFKYPVPKGLPKIARQFTAR